MEKPRVVQITKENQNAAILLQYMHENNVDLNKFVLELYSSVPESISQFIPNGYLVSDRVNELDLKKAKINGARGVLTINGIRIKGPIVRKIPRVDEFDSIISAGYSRDLLSAAIYNTNLYFGFCKDNSEETDKLLTLYRLLSNSLKGLHNKKVEFVHDTFQEKNKQLCLIKVEKRNKTL